jgi:hypothetical protein
MAASSGHSETRKGTAPQSLYRTLNCKGLKLLSPGGSSPGIPCRWWLWRASPREGNNRISRKEAAAGAFRLSKKRPEEANIPAAPGITTGPTPSMTPSSRQFIIIVFGDFKAPQTPAECRQTMLSRPRSRRGDKLHSTDSGYRSLSVYRDS